MNTRVVRFNKQEGIKYIKYKRNLLYSNSRESNLYPGERVQVQEVSGGIILRSTISADVIEEFHWIGL